LRFGASGPELDHLDAFRLQDGIELFGELAVAVAQDDARLVRRWP
jgi:hypothetical protein